MVRTSFQVLLIGGLAIIAFGLAAATLTTPVDSGAVGIGGSDTDLPSSDSPNNGSAPAISPLPVMDGSGGLLSWSLCVESVGPVPTWAALVGGLLGLAVVVRYVSGRVPALAVGLLGIWPVLLVWLLLTAGCSVDPGLPVGGEQSTGLFPATGSETEEGGSTTVTPTVSVPWVILLVVLVIGIGVVIGAFRIDETGDHTNTAETGGPTSEQPVVGPSKSSTQQTELAEQAPDNGVYRAWRRMIEQADIDDDQTRTPTELIDPIVETGRDRTAVQALTTLFKTTRYGTTPPSPAREERAKELLERIEQDQEDNAETKRGREFDGE